MNNINNIEILDIISIIRFIVGLKNYNEILIQTDKPDLMREVDNKTGKF